MLDQMKISLRKNVKPKNMYNISVVWTVKVTALICLPHMLTDTDTCN